MGLTKIGTRKGKTATDVVVIIEIDGQQASLQKQDLTTHNTPAKIKAEIERQIGWTLPLFAHSNRDGSVALAYGEEPTLWPEDEKDE